MKQFVFVIALTCSFFSASAQTYHSFVDTGKVWSTYHNYCKKAEFRFSEFTRFDKDTLIDGHLYKIIWSSPDSNMATWTQSGFIREDAQKKVFHRNPYSTWETTIYDFGGLAGDTIELRQDPYGNYELYTVYSINWVIMLDGKQRQKFFLHHINDLCNETWIEGMGCTKGILGGGTCGMVGDDPSLICFSENDTLLYFNPDFDQCYVLMDIDVPVKPQTEITLFPNPANDNLTIKIRKPWNEKMKFELIDLSGKDIVSIPVLQTETLVNIKHFAIIPGFYIYHVFQGMTLIKTGKIVIFN
jgi:Secretion system C-terminal sorting domain